MGQSDALPPATCVTLGQPACSLGHGVLVPLKLRGGCQSSRSGLCVAQDTKQTTITRQGPRGALRQARRRARAQRTVANRAATHTAKHLGNVRPGFGLLQVRPRPLGLRHRPPPDPGAATSPSPACGASRGPLTWSPCNLPGGSWRGCAGCRGAAGKGLLRAAPVAAERGAGSRAERSRGGVPEQSPPPHFLPGGIEPGGRRLAGDSASLCRWPCQLDTEAAAPIWMAVGPAVLFKT